MGGKLVSSTPSCVAVGTLSELDGESLISLTDEVFPAEQNAHLVFTGWIDTPKRTVSVCTVLNEKLMTIPVSETRSEVHVWANDDKEPGIIRVFIGKTNERLP